MLKGLNVLVVEDNLLNQKIVNFILLKQGAVVKQALNGMQALGLLQETNFDVILMDLQMPEMDGYTAIKHIRENMKNDIPIIALTATLLDSETEEYHNIGMNACIIKPIDPTGLCELILNLTKAHKN